MHVVFFNRSYYPDSGATGQLLGELARGLVHEHGVEVTVVTGPSSSRERFEVLDGVRVHRARGTQLDRRRFIGRFANYVSYFLSAGWVSLWLPRADVVVAMTDPPIIGLVAWLTKKRMGARFVFWCQDVFPEVAALLDDFKSGLVDRVLQTVSRFLVARADRIVAVGEAMKKRLVEGKGAEPSKVSVIHNWADTERLTPGPKDNAFSREHGLADAFCVMHSGNVGLSQNLESLPDVAAGLADEPGIVLAVVGDGVRLEALREAASRRALTNVRFIERQPKERLAESFASADVFLVSLKRGLAGYIVPSKLYGILAAGRPFVAAVPAETEVAAVARDQECGIVVESGDVGGIIDAIRSLHGDRERVRRLGDNARRAGLGYDRRRQVAAYYELFTAECHASGSSVHAPCEAQP